MTVSSGLYAQALAGNVFYATNTTASAIPVANTTAPTFCLWNRASSNVALVLVRYTCALAATASDATSNIQLAYLNPAGDSLATAAPISAFTDGVIQNAIASGTKTPQGVRFGTAATLTAAGTQAMSMGMSSILNTVISFQKWTFSYDFDDMFILRPGTAVYDIGQAATGSTWNRTLWWYTVPASSVNASV